MKMKEMAEKGEVAEQPAVEASAKETEVSVPVPAAASGSSKVMMGGLSVETAGLSMQRQMV